MADHTVKNLKDVENAARKHGMPEEMDARFARGELNLEQMAMSHQRYGPGFRAPFAHKHQQQEELYIVVKGSGRIKIDDDIIEVKELDAVRVPPESVRAFEGGPEGIEILAFSASEGQNDAEQIA